jgi:GNAT superfamily N-acetyltransferase
VSFKSTSRLLETSELHPLISGERCGTIIAEVEAELAGCISWEVLSHDAATGAASPHLHCHFGPFAVAPAHQGRGVGRLLQAAVDEEARRRGCAFIDIEVVDVRTDVLFGYERAGFQRVGTGPFVYPDRCTRPCHFIYLRRALGQQ